jgi:integrase
VATQTTFLEATLPTIRISRHTIARLPVVEKTTVFFDEELKGFGLRVFPTGAKSWVVEYRAGISGRGTAKRRVSLGQPSLVSPEKARQLAKDILAAARVGADPASQRADERAGITVAELADAFMSEHVEPRRKGSTADDYQSILNRLVKPSLGSMKAAKVTRADVAKLHLSLRQTPYSANRMLAVLGAAFSFAEKRGLVPESFNPARKIEKYKESPRERYLTEKELARLGEVIREAEATGLPRKPSASKHAPKQPENLVRKLSPSAAAALRLLLLTGCRVSEILNLRWTEVDIQRGLLFLPDSKTGRKTVVLSGAAAAVIDAQPRLGIYVIAGETAGQKDEKPRADIKKAWELVRSHAGLDGVRLHDLRHSFASVGAGASLGLPMIGKLLGHSQPQTTARYAHLDADPVRAAANVIAGKIEAAMGDARDCLDR